MRFFILVFLFCNLSAWAQETGDVPEKAAQQGNGHPERREHILAVSYNPGAIVSRVYTGYGSVDRRGSGLGITADYLSVGPSGLGYGFSLAHCATRYEVKPTYYSNDTKADIKLSHIGPALALVKSGVHWGFRSFMSLGLAYYHISRQNQQPGFGAQIVVGMEYRVSRVLGFGLDLTGQRCVFPDNTDSTTDIISGFIRVGANIGIRVHL